MCLVTQVQNLKDQLNKLETSSYNTERKTSKQDERNDFYQRLEKEIENLKSELNRNKMNEKSNEIVNQIERHERQKDFLSDHNQVNYKFKLSLLIQIYNFSNRL